MKLSIEQIEKKAAEYNAKKKELSERINTLEKKEIEANDRATAAADAGDLPGYKKAVAESGDIGIELEFSRDLLNKMTGSGVSQQEASAAWKDYADGYNAKFDRMYADFEKKRTELLSTYCALVDLQAEALKTREKLADIGGYGIRLFGIFDKPYDNIFPCRLLPSVDKDPEFNLSFNGTMVKDPDAVFYLVNYRKSKNITGHKWAANDELKRVSDVVGRHTTKNY